MAKSEAIYHGDPRHHHEDITKLKARVKELEAYKQRPEPLTDEELVEIERCWERCWNSQYLIKKHAISRLIADLHASRARVKELEAQIAAIKAPTQWENRSRGW